MRAFRVCFTLAGVALTGLALLLLLPPATSLYYEATGGESCAKCHEIRPTFEMWRSSSHRTVPCRACHGDAMTLDARFHLTNLHRVFTHARDQVPEQVRLKSADVLRMVERCRACHQREYAEWKAGPHSASYARIFLDREHNRKELLVDDCLRCHGAHYEGGIRDLVAPLDTRGPWRLLKPELAQAPAIPCLMCHQMHRQGQPLVKPADGLPAAAQDVARPSVALFDRRGGRHVANLPLPAMLDGARNVRMSPDPRQGLCYQCHAPEATRQVGSGDDRTGMGVHEGLSCDACHARHTQKSRASCANCHPRLSNCGLDVEKMDTTYLLRASRHNIHFVKCGDCHVRGVPRRRADRLTNDASAPGTPRPQTLPVRDPTPPPTRPGAGL
jgi:hypothetical protein